jgi:hypothetical protein
MELEEADLGILQKESEKNDLPPDQSRRGKRKSDQKISQSSNKKSKTANESQGEAYVDEPQGNASYAVLRRQHTKARGEEKKKLLEKIKTEFPQEYKENLARSRKYKANFLEKRTQKWREEGIKNLTESERKYLAGSLTGKEREEFQSEMKLKFPIKWEEFRVHRNKSRTDLTEKKRRKWREEGIKNLTKAERKELTIRLTSKEDEQFQSEMKLEFPIEWKEVQEQRKNYRIATIEKRRKKWREEGIKNLTKAERKVLAYLLADKEGTEFRSEMEIEFPIEWKEVQEQRRNAMVATLETRRKKWREEGIENLIKDERKYLAYFLTDKEGSEFRTKMKLEFPIEWKEVQEQRRNAKIAIVEKEFREHEVQSKTPMEHNFSAKSLAGEEGAESGRKLKEKGKEKEKESTQDVPQKKINKSNSLDQEPFNLPDELDEFLNTLIFEEEDFWPDDEDLLPSRLSEKHPHHRQVEK